MAFVLIARSTGDELIPSKDSVIAVSENREALEQLSEMRSKERAEWLSHNPIPWWAEECITASERIEEVGPVL
jgi:hypothetical protein